MSQFHEDPLPPKYSPYDILMTVHSLCALIIFWISGEDPAGHASGLGVLHQACSHDGTQVQLHDLRREAIRQSRLQGGHRVGDYDVTKAVTCALLDPHNIIRTSILLDMQEHLPIHAFPCMHA